MLKELNIVDTPGTNAVIRYHERLTDEFVPRSDLVLFTTSADHPLTESERQFLERILAWGKKVVFALNKADILEDENALQEIRSFVVKHATKVLGIHLNFFRFRPDWRNAHFPNRILSNVNACGLPAGWMRLERYITSTLDDTTSGCN